MSTQPQWSPLDDETSDLLSLVADGPMSGQADEEWRLFREVLRDAAWIGRGLIDPNDFRGRVRGLVKPQRIGAFTSRALAQGLIAYTGEWVPSTDTGGRNSGKPTRVMRWTGGQL